jgi:two-component system phosphate regulon response regulator PhoB
VWGDHVFIEERTVDVHIRRLRQALGPQGEQLIETVRGAGYKLACRAQGHARVWSALLASPAGPPGWRG